MLTGCNPVTILVFGVWDHTDYHSLPASLPSSSPPSAPSVVPQRIQGFMLLWWAILKSYAVSQIRTKKSPITGILSAFCKNYVFPALGVKTCLVTELCSGCSALQRDLKIHPPRTNSGAEGRGKKISPSAFCFRGAAQGEPSPELSSYPFICIEGLCAEERDCNAKRDEWHLPSFLFRLRYWPISAL